MTPYESSPRIATISAGDDRYQVRSRLEIDKILRRLIASRALVTAHGSDSGAFFVTAVLDVDDDYVVCDFGIDKALTERVLRSRVTLVTQLDHVRIQFASDDAEACTFEDGPAFRLPVPDVVTRLQRREHYRLKVPRGRPLLCQLRLPVDGSPAPADAKRVPLPVYDISCGGLSLAGWPQPFMPRPALEIPDGVIDLPDLGRLVADLRVVHVQGRVGQGPDAGRFGCRFVNLNAGASILVQRYINRIEREQKALM